ncbi:hypothetical protein ACWDSJ_08145 [Nocardia sp. NPDC003482]|uniref:hypothetical protein n=1 Tax=Nocardia sp. NPDC004068 TaxID=3364303 RepID=UPI0036922133
MREDHPSDDDLRREFERALDSVSRGAGLTSESGLDDETENALWAIADAHPDVPPDLIEAARRVFAAQLDGTHARDQDAELDRLLEEFGSGND